jgi:hypothetical protein
MEAGVFSALLILAVVPSQGITRDEVDLVEVNHYHDEAGRRVFDQLIFYDWSQQRQRFQVRAWRLIKHPEQLPQRDYRRDHWRVLWHDGGLLREVIASAYRETWTQYDPELLDRKHLPQDQRRELTGAVPRTIPWTASRPASSDDP